LNWQALGEGIQVAVRPIVTFALTGGVIWGWMRGQISADAFLGLAGAVIGFWFSQRGSSKDAAAMVAQIQIDRQASTMRPDELTRSDRDEASGR